jgi:hypothetical protein
MDERNQTTLHDPLINLLFDGGLQNALPRIAEILMNAAMLLERETHIGAAPYQRGTERNGYANGFKPRTFQTGIGALELSVPQVRESDSPFHTSLLEKGSRSDRALKSAIATMYVEGVSTRRVTRIMEQMCGFQVSSGQVSNLNKQLDEEFAKWCSRPLPEIIYLIIDATYYKVRIDGVVRDCATLIAHGIRRDDGKRMILGVSCALSEAEVHWRGFLIGLKERGIGIPDPSHIRCPQRLESGSQSLVQRHSLAALSVSPPTKRPRIRHQTTSQKQGRLGHQSHFQRRRPRPRRRASQGLRENLRREPAQARRLGRGEPP